MNTNLLKAILGRLLIVYGSVMCLPGLVSLFYRESIFATFLGPALLTVSLGIFLLFKGRVEGRMRVRESYAIVGMGWLLAAIFGALPFSLAHIAPTFIDALFEAVSGLTTTGASVLENLESLPKSILLWRSMTHWLGGMGIIVLFILLLPNVGMGAVHLFNAEVPGPTSEKILPRIRKGALYLWLIYSGFTLILIIMLYLAGMTIFDALNHALATMATGGFSTKAASIAAYNNLAIEVILILFMVIAGVNFKLYINAWSRGPSTIFKDQEFRVYIVILLLASGIVAYSLLIQSGLPLGTALRQAVFQVTSIMTTTGFATVDFDKWPGLAKMVLFFLMFIGGSAGSTTGGIKVARFILLLKMSWAQIKQVLNPHLVVNIMFQGRPVDPMVLSSVGRFFFLFMMVFVCATILITGTGLEPFDAMSAVATTLGNVGPGFGIVGPMVNFASVSLFAKVVFTVCMLLGRLELFTILVLTQPEFWRNYKS